MTSFIEYYINKYPIIIKNSKQAK